VETEEDSADCQVDEDFSLDHPELIGAMLTLMYRGKMLTGEQWLSPEVKDNFDERKKAFETRARKDELNLSFYTRMFQLGCKYDVPLLRTRSIELLKEDVQWDSYYVDMMKAVHIAFHTGSDAKREMRDCVFEALIDDMKSAMQRGVRSD
jgi:hypothetical protein